MNLIRDPQFNSLEQFWISETPYTDITINQNLIDNNYKKLEDFLTPTITTLNESIYIKKASSNNSTKDSVKISKLQKNNVVNAFTYTALDSSATLRKIYFVLEDNIFNLHNYINQTFTVSFDLGTEYSNVKDNSLNVELVYRGDSDGGDDLILGRQSVNLYYNGEFAVSSSPRFKTLKTYKFLMQTLKNTTFPNLVSSNKVMLAITLPTSLSAFNMYISNVGLFSGKVNLPEIKKLFSQSNLETKSLVKSNTIQANNLKVYKNADVTQNLNVTGTSLLNGNTTINSDLRVIGTSKLGLEIAMYNSSGILYGKITKSAANATSKFVFLNGTGDRGELDCVSLYARYADLAEIYKCSNDLEQGDLVQIANNKYYDIEKCKNIKKCIGVISTNPAFIMNTELLDLKKSHDFNVLPIGYLGIVPVKIKGKIKKGDYIKICTYSEGIGKKSFFKSNIISLETNKAKKIKLVKCLIK